MFALCYSPAPVGTVGTVIGLVPGGTLAELVLEDAEGHRHGVVGDARPIHNAFDALLGQQVEVVEGDEMTAVRPLDEED